MRYNFVRGIVQINRPASFYRPEMGEMSMETGIMKASQISSYSGNEVVEITSNALRPKVSEGKVVVEVYAAGVNPVQFPVTLGGDFSGVITEVGKAVSSLHIGDEVYGQASVLHGGSGSFAEYVLVTSSPQRFVLFTGSKSEKNLSLYKKLGCTIYEKGKHGCGDIEDFYLEKYNKNCLTRECHEN